VKASYYVELDFLTYKEGAWSYRSSIQQVLLGDCMSLLNWNMYHFDCWLFDSDKWSMYTRRRQLLIDLRTELASKWEQKANDFAARELLILDFCMQVWAKTRSQEFREVPEIKDMECAYRKAKALRRKLQSKATNLNSVKRKRISPNSRLMPHVLMVRERGPTSF
jgi:hypothetical protein